MKLKEHHFFTSKYNLYFSPPHLSRITHPIIYSSQDLLSFHLHLNVILCFLFSLHQLFHAFYSHQRNFLSSYPFQINLFCQVWHGIKSNILHSSVFLIQIISLFKSLKTIIRSISLQVQVCRNIQSSITSTSQNLPSRHYKNTFAVDVSFAV